MYDCQHLAAKGLVAVTINYRVIPQLSVAADLPYCICDRSAGHWKAKKLRHMHGLLPLGAKCGRAMVSDLWIQHSMLLPTFRQPSGVGSGKVHLSRVQSMGHACYYPARSTCMINAQRHQTCSLLSQTVHKQAVRAFGRCQEWQQRWQRQVLAAYIHEMLWQSSLVTCSLALRSSGLWAMLSFQYLTKDWRSLGLY